MIRKDERECSGESGAATREENTELGIWREPKFCPSMYIRESDGQQGVN